MMVTIRNAADSRKSDEIVYSSEYLPIMRSIIGGLKAIGLKIYSARPEFGAETPTKEAMAEIIDPDEVVCCTKKQKGARAAVFVDFADCELIPVCITERKNFPTPQAQKGKEPAKAATPEDQSGAEIDVCENCGKPATQTDSNGVPLCDSCAEADLRDETTYEDADFKALFERVEKLGTPELIRVLAWSGCPDTREMFKEFRLSEFTDELARKSILDYIREAMASFFEDSGIDGSELSQISVFCESNQF
jgi:hypothetical protein